nr:sulfite exporter TauE/SafE family protein [Ameyamaea chiangmaiensis]
MHELPIVVLCVFAAAIVRGFCGFGFALLVVMSASFVLPTKDIVPGMLLLEVVAGLRLLPSIRGHVHWRSIAIIIAAATVATPAGAFILRVAPAAAMQFGVSILVLLACGMLASGRRLTRMPTTPETAMTGAVAGLLNGSVGLAGPPVILFFLGSPLALEAGRASIIATFLAIDAVALPTMAMLGLFGRTTLLFALGSLPALVVGLAIGARMHDRVDQARARTVVLAVLAAMAVANAVTSAATLLS